MLEVIQVGVVALHVHAHLEHTGPILASTDSPRLSGTVGDHF